VKSFSGFSKYLYIRMVRLGTSINEKSFITQNRLNIMTDKRKEALQETLK